MTSEGARRRRAVSSSAACSGPSIDSTWPHVTAWPALRIARRRCACSGASRPPSVAIASSSASSSSCSRLRRAVVGVEEVLASGAAEEDDDDVLALRVGGQKVIR
eukprot:1579600-Rhodomonas_salina.1